MEADTCVILTYPTPSVFAFIAFIAFLCQILESTSTCSYILWLPNIALYFFISADSSLSPQSATSNSSFDINATSHAHSYSNSQSQNNAPRASSSRHTSPSVSIRDGTGSVTGNANISSSKLSRSASSKDGTASISNRDKEATLPVSASVPATVVTAPPKESKPPLIPGMGAPVPALPGFTKKKKQEKQ
jgi:hypothetical protein